ncbi:MAG: pyridoxamine 5'-phosphate oxidase [Actinomycetota bacterium]|nr:pyridoxamine 5'-phosphate oxidase [Actinomycetota bacterium]
MPDSLRRHTDYGRTPLREADVAADPIAQFVTWLDQAERAGVYEPNAMVLSTIDPDGLPSSRTVLLRGIDEQGLRYFTSYSSDKGRALFAHPEVSLAFPWYTIHRQVIVRGTATPTDAAASDAYFAARPRGAQIAAVASDQSRPIASREALEQKVRDVEERLGADDPVARPEDWGGFLVRPSTIEFWQGRTSRLHDRLRFTRSAAASGWIRERLQP